MHRRQRCLTIPRTIGTRYVPESLAPTRAEPFPALRAQVVLTVVAPAATHSSPTPKFRIFSTRSKVSTRTFYVLVTTRFTRALFIAVEPGIPTPGAPVPVFAIKPSFRAPVQSLAPTRTEPFPALRAQVVLTVAAPAATHSSPTPKFRIFSTRSKVSTRTFYVLVTTRFTRALFIAVEPGIPTPGAPVPVFAIKPSFRAPVQSLAPTRTEPFPALRAQVVLTVAAPAATHSFATARSLFAVSTGTNSLTAPEPEAPTLAPTRTEPFPALRAQVVLTVVAPATAHSFSAARSLFAVFTRSKPFVATRPLFAISTGTNSLTAPEPEAPTLTLAWTEPFPALRAQVVLTVAAPAAAHSFAAARSLFAVFTRGPFRLPMASLRFRLRGGACQCGRQRGHSQSQDYHCMFQRASHLCVSFRSCFHQALRRPGLLLASLIAMLVPSHTHTKIKPLQRNRGETLCKTVSQPPGNRAHLLHRATAWNGPKRLVADSFAEG